VSEIPTRPAWQYEPKWDGFRTADCVVGGFRYDEDTDIVGSLLPGSYDAAGLLQHVGVIRPRDLRQEL
jgi:ATP-dependent DNA ligase